MPVVLVVEDEAQVLIGKVDFTGKRISDSDREHASRSKAIELLWCMSPVMTLADTQGHVDFARIGFGQKRMDFHHDLGQEN